jgi:hypothetical protein
MPRERWTTRGVFAPFAQNEALERYVASLGFAQIKSKYESPVLFHYMSAFYPKKIFEFFERYVRPRRKMFVGCTPRDIAEKLYGPIHHYIQTPPRHAYDSISTWWPQVESASCDIEVMIPSAGAASNIISKRLWHLDRKLHVLDIGSIIDAVEGRRSRTWIKHVGHRMQRILRPEDRDRSMRFHIRALVKDVRYKLRQLYR